MTPAGPFPRTLLRVVDSYVLWIVVLQYPHPLVLCNAEFVICLRRVVELELGEIEPSCHGDSTAPVGEDGKGD